MKSVIALVVADRQDFIDAVEKDEMFRDAFVIPVAGGWRKAEGLRVRASFATPKAELHPDFRKVEEVLIQNHLAMSYHFRQIAPYW